MRSITLTFYIALVYSFCGVFFTLSLATADANSSIDDAETSPTEQTLLKYTPHFTEPAKGTEFVMPAGSGDLAAMVSFDHTLQLHFSKSDWFGRTYLNESSEKSGQARLANMSPGHLTLTFGDLNPADITGFDQYMDFARGSVVVHLETASGAIDIEVFGEMTQKALLLHVSDHRTKKGDAMIAFSNWRPAMTIASSNGILTGEEINKTGADGNPITDSAKVQPTDPIYQLGLGVAIGSPQAVSREAALVVPANRASEYDVIISAQVTRDGAPLQAAITQLAYLLRVDRQQQRQAQLDWWSGFWQKSWVDLNGDKDAEYLTRLWLTDLYTFAGVFGGKLPPAFNCSQLLVMRDYSSWVNIYTFQNTRELIWPMWTANHPEYAALYLHNFDDYYEFLRKKVRDDGKIGLRLPENINISNNPLLDWKPEIKPRELTLFDPVRIEDRSNQKLEEREPNYLNHYLQEGAELSHLMLDHVRFTGDEAFLKNVCAPWIHECTLFYLNYLKSGQDGLWHMEPSDAAETWWKCRDPGIDMCALRHIFGVVVRDGKELGLEPELIELTRNRLEHLAPIPLGKWLERNIKEEELPALEQQYPKVNPRYWGKRATIFNGIDQTKDQYCIAAGIIEDPIKHNAEDPELYLLFPYGRIGLASPPVELQRGLNTFNNRVCVNSYGWSPDGIWAARLGLPNTAEVILQHAHKEQRYPYGGWNNAGGMLPGTSKPNLVNDTPQLDSAGVNMTAIQEMLLQSQDLADDERLLDGGPIRLLPAVRPSWSGSFKLRAQGGFLVVCRFVAGHATKVDITSECGRLLQVFNPFAQCVISVNGQNRQVSGDRIIKMSTKIGDSIKLISQP